MWAEYKENCPASADLLWNVRKADDRWRERLFRYVQGGNRYEYGIVENHS
ncbi:MAG: hypothetical protein HFH75_04000 [Lachnospiraceae bacterium]|nr:hypothetical protein [Lachnospiraceae bacterium]MDE6921309.1 hypothetical protein [Lachnospiraceae bacterium]MDE6990363.1 hypothetical protein [Lachnospiraceae bacterium]MDE7000669.1 hypothetical protein [Lachnospiraceae bacterium]